MNDGNRKKINDGDLDFAIESTVSAMLPETVVKEVTPWKKSINQVLIGSALTAVTLNFLSLNYILPVIGTVLQLLGFRMLRRENGWFKGCFVISVLRGAYVLPLIVLGTTIAHIYNGVSLFEDWLTVINYAVMIILYFCLWRGIAAIQRRLGLPSQAWGAAAMTVWYAVIGFLSFVRLDNTVIGVAMLALYALIICSLFKISKELDMIGYAVKPAKIKITDRAVVIFVSLFLVAGCVCGYALGGSYPMKWNSLDSSEHSEVEDVKNQLLDLGFPEYVLDDISAEDIEVCRNAKRIVSHRFDSVCDADCELRLTGVAVQIEGESEEWMIFHHFLWLEDTGFCGTESIQLLPAGRDGFGLTAPENFGGRVLYDKGGESYTADYYFTGPEEAVATRGPFAPQSIYDVFAVFSMPRDGENCRGYVSYLAGEPTDGGIVYSHMYYTHQRSPLQYPVMTAAERRLTGVSRDYTFVTTGHALHFNSAEEDS